jgi:hypothetical protein
MTLLVSQLFDVTRISPSGNRSTVKVTLLEVASFSKTRFSGKGPSYTLIWRSSIACASSTQLRQTHGDQTSDHSGDGPQPKPVPNVVSKFSIFDTEAYLC